MEWGKIKAMFIYLFLILNLILFILYIYTIDKNKAELYQERDAIIKAIKNDNIEIIEPNNKKDNVGYVSATVKNFSFPEIKNENYTYELVLDGEIRHLEIKMNEPLTNVKNVNYKEILDNFVLEKLSKELTYSFDMYDEKNKKIIYIQTVDGIKIYGNTNSTLEFKVEDNGDIKQIKQKGLSDLKKDNVENIASHTQAIYKLYHENFIPHDSKVKSSLGYYTSVSQLTNQILIPTWRVEVYNGSTTKYYYVDAINIKILDKDKNK